AVVVVALALVPGAVLAVLTRALQGVPALAAADSHAFGATLLPSTGAFAPVLLLALGAWAAFIARSIVGKGAAAPRAVWTGGVVVPRDDATLHPLGFYSPLREGLRRAYAAPHWHALPRPAWVIPATDLDRWFYRPATAASRRLVSGLRRTHTGVPHLYLVWQLAGAVALALLLLVLLKHGGTP
ncbi:MAG TPA: hypothetical protein VLV15_00565, partial [Dongiaceae bacterium]|nr:hypothetical protein [Dongiaceae bacterium]